MFTKLGAINAISQHRGNSRHSIGRLASVIILLWDLLHSIWLLSRRDRFFQNIRCLIAKLKNNVAGPNRYKAKSSRPEP